jgi:hypothetical protein
VLASHAPTAWIWLYCRDEAVMVMTTGWIGRLLAADAALLAGVRVGEPVGLVAGHNDTRMAAVATASTAAAAMAIARRLCLRVRSRWEAGLPPGWGRSGRPSVDVGGLVGRYCRSKMGLC